MAASFLPTDLVLIGWLSTGAPLLRVWLEGRVKKAKEVMEILEAYDLAGSLRGAAKLAGCDHKTVAHWVRQRELAAGLVPVRERARPAMAGTFIA